jgi:hypothetical protein
LLTQFVDLSECRKCSEGSQREIYEHPALPDVLIKVVKPTKRGARGVRLSQSFGWLKKYRRFGAYMTYRREIEEYLEQARKVEADESFSLPLAKIFGLVHTSGGLGLVVEKISTSSAAIAPTLSQILAQGQFGPLHLELIDRFFETCRRNHIVLMDINVGNFVVTDRSGKTELVCIDGTGEKSCFRLYASSRVLNSWKLHFARKKLLTKIERHQAALRSRREIELSMPSVATSGPERQSSAALSAVRP